MKEFTAGLDIMIKAMALGNAAIPTIASLVTVAITLWNSRPGQGEVIDLRAYADKIEAQVRANQAYGESEVLRLRALIGA